jgi:Tol biopolymer transport system component
MVSDQLAIGFWPVGVTNAGSLFYAAAEGVATVYVADVVGAASDVATPARLSAANEPALTPEWSPDGRTVAWVARSRATGPPGTTLRLRDVDTGRERTIPTSFVIGQSPRWSPDGTRLLIRGSENGVDALRLVDVDTGRLVQTYLAGRQFGDVEWSADGTAAFFVDFKQRLIGKLNIGSGDERIVYRLPGKQQFNRGIALSPDGATIAFHSFEGDSSAIMSVPARGGTPRTLYVVPPQHRVIVQEWTRDGRNVLFVRSRAIAGAGPSQEWQLWSLGAADGALHYLDLSMPSLGAVRPSPDGRRLVLSSSNAANRLRVLDNVFTATP